jgi:hypothetical protein
VKRSGRIIATFQATLAPKVVTNDNRRLGASSIKYRYEVTDRFVIALAEDARESCPTESIGRDGDGTSIPTSVDSTRMLEMVLPQASVGEVI